MNKEKQNKIRKINKLSVQELFEKIKDNLQHKNSKYFKHLVKELSRKTQFFRTFPNKDKRELETILTNISWFRF